MFDNQMETKYCAKLNSANPGLIILIKTTEFQANNSIEHSLGISFKINPSNILHNTIYFQESKYISEMYFESKK